MADMIEMDEMNDLEWDNSADPINPTEETGFDGIPTEGVNLIRQKIELKDSFLGTFEQHKNVKANQGLRSLLLADLRRRDDGCWYWKDLRLRSKQVDHL